MAAVGSGQLELVDGVFLEIVEAAKAEPDRPFVLVIEEINRGNPAQIFGEILTLLEDTKRSRRRRWSSPIAAKSGSASMSRAISSSLAR